MIDFIRNLFGKTKAAPPMTTDFSGIGTDLHSHLIPGIDDGVKSTEEALTLLRHFARLGYKKVITTPHVVTDSYNNSSETIIAGRDKLRLAIAESDLQIELEAAAEYYVDESLLDKIAKGDLLTLGDRFVLVEFAFGGKPPLYGEVFYQLQVAGYQPILAHPERYPYFYEKSFESYRSLKDRNVLFQINIAALAGRYGKEACYTAERLIDEGMVELIGSDLHNERQIESIELALKNKHLQSLMQSGKLLNQSL